MSACYFYEYNIKIKHFICSIMHSKASSERYFTANFSLSPRALSALCAKQSNQSNNYLKTLLKDT